MDLHAPVGRSRAALGADLAVTAVWAVILTEAFVAMLGWPRGVASLIAVLPVLPVALYHLWADAD